MTSFRDDDTARPDDSPSNDDPYDDAALRSDEPAPFDDSARFDDETRVDVPIAAEEAPVAAAGDSHPPVFPSVGGVPPGQEPYNGGPPFAPLFREPVGSSRVTVDSPAPVHVEPVGGRTARWRWISAAVATLAVVALVAGILFFGAQQVAPSLVAEFAPADAAAYAEVRLDLPGDQRDSLVSFLGHFPGFADPATFQQKLDDTLANALRATGTGLEWKTDVDPWFGGQIGFFTSSLAPTYGTPPSFSVVLSIKDRTRLDQLVAERTTGMQQEEYKGQTIWSGNATDVDQRLSFAVTDEAFVVSARNEDLKAALDVKSGAVAGLAKDAFFLGQLGQMHADRLALFYYDYSSVIESMPMVGTALPAGCLDDIYAAASLKLVGEVRAEADHLAASLRSQFPTGGNLPAAPPNKRTNLAESMPSGTLAYMEMRQVGAQIKFLVSELLECMGPAAGLMDMDQIQMFLGESPENYFNFLDDAAFAVTLKDGKAGGGLIATVDDENVARARVDRLVGALGLLGGVGGGGFTVDQEQHGDAAITVISIDNEFMLTDLPTLAISVTRGRIYIGLDDFVTGALDRAAADSLSATPRLQQALASTGAENAGIIYFDFGTLRGFIESSMPAEVRTQYETEIKPFVEPFTHLISINRTENGINAGHMFLYVE